MRTNRIRVAGLAAVTAALALSVTACGGSDSAKDTGAKEKTATEAYTAKSSADVGTRSATDTAVPAAHQITKDTAATRQCSGNELSYDVLHRFPKQLGEHLLVTARNTGSKACWVTSYPSVMLGDTSNVLPHSKKDAPGGSERITVRPGGKVYSAVALFADSAKTHTSSELSLALRDQTGDTGPAVELKAHHSKGAPSKFTWSDADVLNWNTEKPYDF
ncbi:DUF4232 domain-containing protein [Streptomyces sp. NPDC053560]|uniref:DUF4232 domain-containing protein n=1 Tax=Streptomyces sp. NPDC053560 TaxID=3365711 RepID=UPI0037D76C2C